MPSYNPRPTPAPAGRSIKTGYSAREVYEANAFELNKVSAPSIDVDTFNHFFRAARHNWYLKQYQLYDQNQLTTDQLRELSATIIYTATSTPALNVGLETFPLPTQYYHMLSVTVFWKALSSFRIYKQDDVFDYMAERISLDKLAAIRKDHYNKPQLKKPYFLVRNTYVEIQAGLHQAAQLNQVEANYLLLPEDVTLYDSDLNDLTTDPSQRLRESGVVTLEIIKDLTQLVLENQGNVARLQTYIPLSRAEAGAPDAQPQAQAQPAQAAR